MNDPIILSGDDVISMDKERSFVNAKLLKFEDMDRQIKKILWDQIPEPDVWRNESGKAIHADVLQPGKNWQKGKLRLVVSYRVEFTPDQLAESPLDDLRSQLNPE